MLFSERLTKVDVLVLKKDVEILTNLLVDFKTIHILDINEAMLESYGLHKNDISNFTIYNDLRKRLDYLKSVFRTDVVTIESISKSLTEEDESVFDLETVQKEVKRLEDEMIETNKKLEEIRRRINDIKIKIQKINFFSNIDVELSHLNDIKQFFVSFGIIPVNNYKAFVNSVMNLPVIYKQIDIIGDDNLLFIACPKSYENKITAILNNVAYRDYGLGFDITPEDSKKIVRYAFDLSSFQDEELWLINKFEKFKNKNVDLLNKLERSINYLIRKEKLKSEIVFTEKTALISGWIPEKEVKKLKTILDERLNGRYEFLNISARKFYEETGIKPPTLLNHKSFLHPFEGIVKTFGTPGYNEIDPTFITAITYIIMYGVMFGDIGHGIALIIIGLIIKYLKNIPTMIKYFCDIIIYIGFSSIFFGILYGEVFGLHNIFKPVWLSPIHHVGEFLLISVIFGAGMISIALLLSIVNYILAKEYLKMIFSPNGIAGILLYWSIFIIAILGYLKIKVPFFIYLFIIISIIMIMFEKLFENIFSHKKHEKEKFNIGMGFLEFFEAILSFFTNTVSFMRVAAFALNHSALMSVVYILSNMTDNVIAKFMIITIGNVFIICFEGFIVGIQVLRLEYYELYMKFFRADGINFKGVGLYKDNE